GHPGRKCRVPERLQSAFHKGRAESTQLQAPAQNGDCPGSVVPPIAPPCCSSLRSFRLVSVSSQSLLRISDCSSANGQLDSEAVVKNRHIGVCPFLQAAFIRKAEFFCCIGGSH